MTSNLKNSLRSLRLGLAVILTLFIAVASWATDVTYTYTMSWKENVLRYTGTITSNTGKISNNFSSDNRADYVLLKGNESASVSEDDFSIEFACFRDVYKGSSNNSFRVTHGDAKITITINNKNNNSYKIRKVTIKKPDGEDMISVSDVTTPSSVDVELLRNIEFSTIVVELTNKPYYSVTPAEGFAIVNTDGFVVDGTAYFHPNTSITIAPTSAVQLITKVTTPTTGATIASDKRSFSFAMPQSNITPSATLEEAHSVALTGNVSISEPLFTDGDTRYYKPGDLITVTTTKTNEIIDGITGIADYTIADDKKSATFTMPTSDLTLAVTTFEVYTMSVPSGMTLSDPYITIGDVKYYKKGETYTLTAPQYNIIDGFTATGAQSSSVSSDKRSATVTIGSANVTATATLFEVHTMNIAGGMTLSPPFITIAGVKYYRKGGTYTFTAPTYNIIESFTATGAQSSTISADKRTAKVTVGTANVTTTASLTEVHTLSVPEGMTLSDPYTTIAGVKYYKRGETYTFTAPEYNIIESFTAMMADDKSVSSDKRSATVTIGQSDVDPIAELTEVHTVTAQDGITLSEAYTNILGTDYYKYGQEVTFGFSGSGSMVYCVNGKRIDGNSVTVDHENLMVQMGVPYIDENGEEKAVVDYTVLTSTTDVSNLPGGWYVVQGEVSYTSQVYFSDNAYLILADGAKMEIETEGESAIQAYRNLKIYGQSGQRGILKTTVKGFGGSGIYGNGNITISGGTVTATSESVDGIYCDGNVTISGGTVTATGKLYGIYSYKGVTISGGVVTATGKFDGIYGYKEVTISGGTVTATSESGDGIYCDGNVTISGGTVTATGKLYGIYGKKGIILSWTKITDAVKASCLVSSDGNVIIADGKSFTDEDGKVYSGTLNSDQLSAIKGKTLTPASIKYVDENGNEKSIYEYTVLTSTTDVSKLPGGWYVVQGEVSYTNTVKFSDDAYLILADGAKIEIETEGNFENGITVSENLTIYGQSGQSGMLKTTAKGLNSYGINGYEGVTIIGGKVIATGEKVSGINGNDITIIGGKVIATGEKSGINGNDITISGGVVTATGNFNGIYGYEGVTIIGGTVTATSESGDGIYSYKGVTISGGSVTATGNEYGIYGYEGVTINDGFVTATGNEYGIYSYKGVTISGGTVTATSERGDGIYSYKGVTISGGNVTATGEKYGIYTISDITLSWTNPTDKIKASSYYCEKGSVIISDGKYFKDEKGHIYVGMLSSNQVEAISQQVIKPLPWKNVGDYSAVQIFEDGNGKKHAVIEGDYELRELVKIPEPVAVDAIEFVRDFDANTPSTVLLPFSLPSCATVNAKFYTLDNVSQSGNKWVATVASIGNALPEANTAYAVMLPTDGRLEFNFDGCSTAEKKQAIFQTGKIETSGNADGSWYFTGTYEFIHWSNPNYIEAVGDGLIYGFAGSNEKGIAKGQFGRVDYSAEINPLRCYLRKKSSDVKLQSLAKSASPVLKAAPYSVSLLPETIDVKFVDKDENGEHTTAIGRMDPRTGKIRLLRTDRTYDLKGRRVNDVNRAAKGAYYGKKL